MSAYECPEAPFIFLTICYLNLGTMSLNFLYFCGGVDDSPSHIFGESSVHYRYTNTNNILFSLNPQISNKLRNNQLNPSQNRN